MIVVFQFADTITAGSVVIAILVGLSGLTTFLYGVRWKTTAQVNEANAKAWQETAQRLEGEVIGLREKVARLEAQVADLRKHDLEHVMQALVGHEKSASERHERTISVLGEIRDRLPETR